MSNLAVAPLNDQYAKTFGLAYTAPEDFWADIYQTDSAPRATGLSAISTTRTPVPSLESGTLQFDNVWPSLENWQKLDGAGPPLAVYAPVFLETAGPRQTFSSNTPSVQFQQLWYSALVTMAVEIASSLISSYLHGAEDAFLFQRGTLARIAAQGPTKSRKATGLQQLERNLTNMDFYSRPIASEVASLPLVKDPEQLTRILDPAEIVDFSHRNAVLWLEEHAGLSEVKVAEFVGVTRQSIRSWKSGGAIRDLHRQRLLAVKEILERAARTHGGAFAIQAWLDTPQGANAQTPRSLLKDGLLGQARMMAISTVGRRDEPLPEWVLKSKPDEWTRRQLRRRNLPAFEDENQA